MKIKVVHFIHGLNTGGAETLVKNYLINFDKTVIDPVLVCLNHCEESPYEEILKNAGIRAIYIDDYLPNLAHLGFFAKGIKMICRFFVFRRVLRHESPDILHTHLPINAYVKFARPKKRTIVFHTVHSDPIELWNNSRSRKRDFRAAKWLVARYNMRFIALHEGMRVMINEMFDVTNTIVINNGVDVERIKNARGEKTLLADLGIARKSFVIGHVGRFSVQKNQAFLIDVFQKICAKRENAFLLMVGDGPERKDVERKIREKNLEDRCLILSNRDDVSRLLGIMDIFIFPSIYEGIPLSLVEAQVAKKPCFVSDSINDYAIISDLVTKISLKQGSDEWSNIISAYRKPQEITVDDTDWDIRNVTKKLESTYLKVFGENKNGGR